MADKTGFKYIRDSDEGDGDLYQASFQIPDDGCPDSEQYLRVSILTHDEKSTEVILDVLTSGGTRKRRLGVAEAGDIHAVACLLYGAASLKTIKKLTPV